VIKEPEDLEVLAKELTVRHTKVGRQRMQRLDTVYRYSYSHLVAALPA